MSTFTQTRRYLTSALLFALMLAMGAQAQTELVIRGVVRAGSVPLPGVNIVIGDLSGRKVVTSTGPDGTFSATVPGEGRWVVRAELAAFSSTTREVVIDGGHPTAQADLQLVLLSRVPSPQQSPQRTIGASGSGSNRGFQRLNVTEQAGAADLTGNGEPLPGLPSIAASGEMATESISVSGTMGSTQDYARNFEDLRDRLEEARERGQMPDGQMPPMGGPGGMGGGPMGGPGGMGPMGGGMGRMGGGGGFGGRGGMRGFNVNQPHGSLFYSFGNSALDAAPYSLSGLESKPDYGSSRFGAVLGGPLRIPGLFDAGLRTFYFLSVAGTRATSPYDVFSRVPTVDERNGIFTGTTYTSGPNAGQPVALFYPGVTGNVIPQELISPQAKALLNYIPLPNQPGLQNFRYSTAQNTDGLNIGARLIHNFGAAANGRRGGGGARRGRARNNLNFAFNYSSGSSDLLRPFPTVGGTSTTNAYSANLGHSLTHGRWTNQLRFNFNHNQVSNTNQFAGITNVAANAHITGVSQNPADWGVPALAFSDFSGLNDIAPLSRRDRVFQVTDTANWIRGKHSLRVGGDFRRMLTRVHNNTNPWGQFLFTGFATAALGADGKPVSGTGYDLADFLLGLPQQTSIQYSPYTYHFAANAYDVFVQDSWRVRANLTLELGLRYEYVSPYTESQDRLVNLDAAPGFTAVAAVQPGSLGALSGTVYPAGLVHPDRNNFAPRLGVAWKPLQKAVLRAGYGVNYNIGQYKSIVQQLAFQPPFSTTQTNIASAAVPLTLADGFPAPVGVLTNNYGVDPNYRLGYVQMWNLNLQYELTPTLMLNVGYTGSKGTALDIVEAPNRTASGLLLPNVQSFLWETSAGNSILHSGSVRLRKRMTSGLSIGGTYTYSKSIDNASSIGGGAVVVAQDPLDLAGERGLSSFDLRHRATGDFLYELPFGTGKRWLDHANPIARLFGDWTWSGAFTVQSGNPWTARVLGNFADVNRGTNGTLRAAYNGQAIASADPTITQWFNTAAFAVPPTGVYGDAGRNTIIGPGMFDVDMSLAKNIPIREMMGLELRITASNVFNTPHYTAIDTVVNSPTFGQVISVGPMRKLQVMTRFRF